MQDNKWLSMSGVCNYLHISRDTVMNWIKKRYARSSKGTLMVF